MGSRQIHLYVSGTTWLAGDLAPQPLRGEHASPMAQKWDLVGQQLRKAGGGRREVSVVLSARLCRALVLPWTSGCHTTGAIRRQVAEAFAAGHGVTDASHHVQVQWPDFGAPILAVAYARDLADALAAGLGAAGLRLANICVSAVPVLSKYGRRLGDGPALLAWDEDDGITAVTVDAGRVLQLESLPRDGHGLEDLAVWASRKRMAFASDEALRWLATSSAPVAFAAMPVDAQEKPVSPGHAVVHACR